MKLVTNNIQHQKLLDLLIITILLHCACGPIDYHTGPVTTYHKVYRPFHHTCTSLHWTQIPLEQLYCQCNNLKFQCSGTISTLGRYNAAQIQSSVMICRPSIINYRQIYQKCGSGVRYNFTTVHWKHCGWATIRLVLLPFPNH